MPDLRTFMAARRFEKQLKEKVDPQVCVTELVRCKNGAGKAFFAYIRIKPSEYMGYKMKLERGEPVNPNHYEILEYGWGEDPPRHLMERMEEQYGVDHNFEKNVRTLREGALQKAAV